MERAEFPRLAIDADDLGVHDESRVVAEPAPAERDVHDRLQAALADMQASVLRVGVAPEPEKPFTVDDDPPSVVHETLWGDASSDEVSVRRRSA